MIYENEITVEVNTDIKSLEDIFKKNNFKKKEEYNLIDNYMIKKDFNINNNYLEALQNCILIRNIITNSKNIKKITYKYKEYNDIQEIIKQGKIDCEIINIADAKELFKELGYIDLININDNIIVYANEKTELCVQMVNNKHIYIEIEEKCKYINKIYNNIEEMKKDLSFYNIPLKSQDYFVKKAEIELKEKFSKI